MKEITSRALEVARRQGAQYADIRVVQRRTESIRVKNKTVQNVSTGESTGFGVRVLYDGAWGFASSARLDPAEVEEVTREAVSIARASALVKKGDGVRLSPVDAAVDTWKSPLKIDPFLVKMEDKIALLLEATKVMLKEKDVRLAEGSMSFFAEKKIFASTEGAYIEQEKTETGAGITATAVAGGEVQRRSYPTSFGGNFAARGYEFVQEMHLVEEAERVAREAAELLQAPQAPAGVTDLILDSSQLALQIHESCGHPIELDRVFGQEASFAGTSFLTPEKLGHYRYGSDLVNIRADATLEGGLGTFGYDDEGVPAQNTPIVEKGIFKNYLSSRETAAELGLTSTGAMRADGWNRMPIIRMTNINLDPGDWTLEEIIRDTKEGILMATNKSWSIDDKRLNFQFGTEIAWEIKDGSLGRMLKNPTYTGITPQFWGSMDAVAGPEEWTLWGVPNCGKGEPMQSAHVGHGAAPARFRKVRVGVGKW